MYLLIIQIIFTCSCSWIRACARAYLHESTCSWINKCIFKISLCCHARCIVIICYINFPNTDIRGRTDRPSASGLWYYWKLKPNDVTAWSQALVWGCYSLHQLSIWAIVYMAQLDSATTGRSKTDTNLTRYNWAALGVNILFQIVHFLQTNWTYDALAQDTSLVSSQCSVIMLLMVICMMQYPERGLFCGWPLADRHRGALSQLFILGEKPTQLARRYHGYALSWATIYTFWYHPMENTMGHVTGFVYCFFLMLQGSLMMTKLHQNRYWRVLLEVWVLGHGGYMVYQSTRPGNLLGGLWLMVVFGFLMTFTFTQIYLLPFWKNTSRWFKAIPPLTWTVIVIVTYSYVPDANGRYYVRMRETTRIPFVYYAGVFALNAFMQFCLAIDRHVKKDKDHLSVMHRTAYLMAALLIFISFIGVSIYIELASIPISFLMTMALLYTLFSAGAGLIFLLMNHTFPIPQVRFSKNNSGTVMGNNTQKMKTNWCEFYSEIICWHTYIVDPYIMHTYQWKHIQYTYTICIFL